jgi:hypothetical protein
VEDSDLFELPVYGQDPDSDQEDSGPSCSPTAFVSNEESAIANAMQGLRESALEIRRKLEKDVASEDRESLERRLSELRDEWSELSVKREKAYVRKMVMLGHLPPEALIE